MTTTLSTLIRLRAIQNKTKQLFENLNDLEYRLQFNPYLSPAGWYLNQGFFMENYWLHEVIQGNNSLTSDKSLYFPTQSPLPEQGPRLPPLPKLLKNISTQQDINDLLLLEKAPPLSEHPLFKDEYIENVIIQQYARNYESIHIVLNQIALKKHKRDKKRHPYIPETPLTPQPLLKNISQIHKGHYVVGGEAPYANDIECPAHEIQLDDYFIASTPVTNGQYLLFMTEKGYSNKRLWSHEGWHWHEKNNIQHPEYWVHNLQNQWYGVNHLGPHELNINDAVQGISQYEASAFAHWAGGRLPHEHEWETAARLEVIKNTTHAWEWCNNTLAPYHNYKPYPLEQSPVYYHDNSHYILKGASQYTRRELWRASYRNAASPHQRHFFAGLRLIFD